jgi:histidinol phosphatase-like PHP family hydrolase
VNTKGLKMPVKECYTSPHLLNLYIKKARINGVQPVLTLGSDAHRVDEIGYAIARTVQNLRALGITTLTGFEKREKSAINI